MHDRVILLFMVFLMLSRKPIAWGTGWVWPVAGVSRLTQEFKPATHLGVDIIGPGTTIVAARSGRVWSVGKTKRGIAVVIDHGKPFATFYQHLASASVSPGQLVVAGQPIGIMGIDPLDSEQVLHLHFAVWHEGAGDNASVDPTEQMKTWRRV